MAAMISISKLRPYENNARTHSKKQIELIANSIREFGFVTPVIIDESNMILVGHGRVEAAKLAGLTAVPFRRVTHLTADQKRAYILADNRLSDISGWDMELLGAELENIDLDMGDFGFDHFSIPTDDDGWYGDERERTNKAYHLEMLAGCDLTNDFWQMPVLQPTDFIPRDLIGFNYAKTAKDKSCGIHFYIDDYQFERLWNSPEKYVDLLFEYDCILTPDFSLYMDMPMPTKIWNTYRSRQLGAFYQGKGLTVIPTVSWAEPETYAFCFQGIPKNSTVSISTVGVKENPEALAVWRDGVREMIEQLAPAAILIYGGKLDYDYGGIKTVYYENKVTENWKKN